MLAVDNGYTFFGESAIFQSLLERVRKTYGVGTEFSPIEETFVNLLGKMGTYFLNESIHPKAALLVEKIYYAS